jgi:hypothetical protein
VELEALFRSRWDRSMHMALGHSQTQKAHACVSIFQTLHEIHFMILFSERNLIYGVCLLHALLHLFLDTTFIV